MTKDTSREAAVDTGELTDYQRGYVDCFDGPKMQRLLKVEAAARQVDGGWFAVTEGENVRLRYASHLPTLLNALRAALATDGAET